MVVVVVVVGEWGGVSAGKEMTKHALTSRSKGLTAEDTGCETKYQPRAHYPSGG